MQNPIQALILRRFRTLASPTHDGRGFMRHQFSIARHLLAAWALFAILVAAPVRAADVVLAPDAPSRYVVKKGDTLWSISGKFLKDPWRWPDIWRMNRSEIKNPHWIYPGDV